MAVGAVPGEGLRDGRELVAVDHEAPANIPGETELIDTEENRGCVRMDAIGADERCSAVGASIGLDDDSIISLLEDCDALTEVNHARWQMPLEDVGEIGA